MQLSNFTLIWHKIRALHCAEFILQSSHLPLCFLRKITQQFSAKVAYKLLKTQFSTLHMDKVCMLLPQWHVVAVQLCQ